MVWDVMPKMNVRNDVYEPGFDRFHIATFVGQSS